MKVTSSSDNFVFLLFSLCMPCDTEYDNDNNETFLSILREVSDLSESSGVDFVVCGGDFNCDLKRVRSFHTQTLLSFIDNEHFEFTSRMPASQNVCFTYESKANNSRSVSLMQ